MQGLSLRPCSSSSDDVGRERIAIQHLEQEIPGESFSMVDLERCYAWAISPVTRILVGDLIERTLDEEFEEIAEMVSAVAENDELCQRAQDVICSANMPLKQVVTWTLEEDCSDSGKAQILKRFSIILETLRHDVEYPCETKHFKNQGFATWPELREVSETFMKTKHAKLSDALEVILFLRRQPFLDMRNSSSTEPSKKKKSTSSSCSELTLDRFDQRIERLRSRYPILDKLTDPALVIVETVGCGPPPSQVGALIASIATASINPMPSNVVPFNLPDVAGPPGAVFANAFRTDNLKEARTFAAMLRGSLADANNVGGLGPTRILVGNCSNAGFRVF